MFHKGYKINSCIPPPIHSQTQQEPVVALLPLIALKFSHKWYSRNCAGERCAPSTYWRFACIVLQLQKEVNISKANKIMIPLEYWILKRIFLFPRWRMWDQDSLKQCLQTPKHCSIKLSKYTLIKIFFFVKKWGRKITCRFWTYSTCRYLLNPQELQKQALQHLHSSVIFLQ